MPIGNLDGIQFGKVVFIALLGAIILAAVTYFQS
jgi:hypothetical protein